MRVTDDSLAVEFQRAYRFPCRIGDREVAQIDAVMGKREHTTGRRHGSACITAADLGCRDDDILRPELGDLVVPERLVKRTVEEERPRLLVARVTRQRVSNGAKVGSVGQVYLDDQSGDPCWVTIKTGLFGTSESFAPLQGANVNGDDVTIAYTKEQVKDAPRVESDGQISPEEEDRLYRHYELSGHADHTDHTENSDRSDRTDAATTGRTDGNFLDNDRIVTGKLS